ncbi:MAG: metalloprotease [Aestuariibaculum sp.]
MVCFLGYGQNKIDIAADFDMDNGEIMILQTIRYQNTTQDELTTIYLNNWSNSFSTKKTPLAKRLAEEYKSDFHLAKDIERGYSSIAFIKQKDDYLKFQPLKKQPDIIKVELNEPLKPNSSYTIQLQYKVKLPSDKFTGYGYNKEGNLNLKYWFITPAVYNGKWHYYSNKNLDDLFVAPTDMNLDIKYPKEYTLTSELDIINSEQLPNKQRIILVGTKRVDTKLILSKTNDFEIIQNDSLSLICGTEKSDLELMEKILLTEKIINYVSGNFGKYPHKKLLITKTDYNKDPVYGSNLLPKFIKPFPKNFNYEIKLLKVVLRNYLENTLIVNPRKEQWLIDGIQNYCLINYVNTYYPNVKLFGSLSNIWGIKTFHAADLYFNEKYPLGFLLMARTNRDQPLAMAKDSLLKFNHNIANKYKAGLGFNYLNDFVGKNTIKKAIDSFVCNNKLKPINIKDFENYISSKTDKNIDWFFNDYVKTRKTIDFKIKKIKKNSDSVTITIKNKKNNGMPISLYTLKDDSIVSKTWIENLDVEKTLTLPKNNADKLVLDYENLIPEINKRDNQKYLKGFLINRKPLQLRLLKDFEDPNYNQVFFMPLLEFNNIYDGVLLGTKIYNTTVLRKQFNYKIQPVYALNSKALTGSGAIYRIHNFKNSNLYYLNYGIVGSYTSYAKDLFVRTLKPTVRLLFRNNNDFRSNKRQAITVRYVDIKRDKDVNNTLTSNKPNYGVFNIRYIHSNDNLINFSKWYGDFQASKTFTKVAFNYEYRKLFENNRQLNLRVFTGAFIRNKSNTDNGDYFSFALDRPTDYLFDYNYLGRSEATGIFSQQYIDAEGGFKSKLKTSFANQWISTVNTSTTLWKYVLAYGDLGLVKSKHNNAKFVYDSGIRVNLVTDYFELYFPIYSNLGWEITQPRYDQKIRFKFTVDPETLFGLFRRRWY